MRAISRGPSGPKHGLGDPNRPTHRHLTALIGAAALCVGMTVALAPAAQAAGGGSRYVGITNAVDAGNDCTAEASPCATIQHAVNEAGAGDTIYVAAGTYVEFVNVNKSLTILGPNASVSPNTSDPTQVNGSRAPEAVIMPASADGKDAFKIGSGLDVTISGVTIDLSNAIKWLDGSNVKSGQAYVKASNSKPGARLTLTNNIFSHAHGVSAGYVVFDNSGTGAVVTITDNRFTDEDIASNGVHIPSSATGTVDVTVQRNVWLDNSYSALNFSSGAATGNSWTITDNWVGNSTARTSADKTYEAQSGFLLAGTYSDLTVANNHFKNIEAFAFYLAYGFNGAADISDNTVDGYHGEIDPGYAAGGWGVVTAVTSSGSATTDLSGVTFKHNSLNGLGSSEAIHLATAAGKSTTGTLRAQENYWDRAEGPRVSQISSASAQSVDYDPWCLDAACASSADVKTTTVATPSHHPGWGNDPDPATSGAPAYVASSNGTGGGALNLVGSPAVDYYHPASLPLGEVNQLSFSQNSVVNSTPLTVQLRITGALNTGGSATADDGGFASLVWAIPAADMKGSWQTQALDLTIAKFQSTRAIHGLAKWDGTGMTLGDIARNNPDAKVTMYGVFRGSTNAASIPTDGAANALVDLISLNRAVTDFELDSASPAAVNLTSTPAARNGWSADNTAPAYTTSGTAEAHGAGSLKLSIAGGQDHVDYFHSVDPANTSFDMHSTAVVPPNAPLVGVQGLGFKVKVESGSFPAYQLRIYGALNAGGTTLASDGGYAALNWEPSYNGGTSLTPDGDGWVTLSALEDGQWWSSRTIKGLCKMSEDVANCGSAGKLATLAQIAFENPNAVIVAYGVNLGSGPAASTAYVDDVTFAGTTTNFEPDANTNTNTNNGGGGGGGGDSTPAGDGIEVLGATDRISGSNRYETSALISDFFGTADAVVIANGSDAKDGADALAANYLAGLVGAPILLTEATTVPASVIAAVKSVLKGSDSPTIYVMGKTDSVSAAAANAIKAAAESVATGKALVVRVAGDNRYKTSAAAASQGGEAGVKAVKITAAGPAAKTAILASGTVNADPLSAAPISYAMGIPVLLTDGATLDPAVAAAITDLGITQLLVLGGTDRVSASVVAATGIAADKVVRIAAANRFATSASLYTFALTTMGYHDGKATDTYLGNAYGGFPDVLTVGPLAGKSGAAVLTVGDGDGLDAAVQTYLRSHSTANITAVGGQDRVSEAQVTLARDLANG